MDISNILALLFFVMPGFIAYEIQRYIRDSRDTSALHKPWICLLVSVAIHSVVLSFNSWLKQTLMPIYLLSGSSKKIDAQYISSIAFAAFWLIILSILIGVVWGLFFRYYGEKWIHSLTMFSPDKSLWQSVFKEAFMKYKENAKTESSRGVVVQFQFTGSETVYRAAIDSVSDIGSREAYFTDVKYSTGKDFVTFISPNGGMFIDFDKLNYIFIFDIPNAGNNRKKKRKRGK